MWTKLHQKFLQGLGRSGQSLLRPFPQTRKIILCPQVFPQAQFRPSSQKKFILQNWKSGHPGPDPQGCHPLSQNPGPAPGQVAHAPSYFMKNVSRGPVMDQHLELTAESWEQRHHRKYLLKAVFTRRVRTCWVSTGNGDHTSRSIGLGAC